MTMMFESLWISNSIHKKTHIFNVFIDSFVKKKNNKI